jgi:hypothetical protein
MFLAVTKGNGDAAAGNYLDAFRDFVVEKTVKLR